MQERIGGSKAPTPHPGMLHPSASMGWWDSSTRRCAGDGIGESLRQPPTPRKGETSAEHLQVFEYSKTGMIFDK